MCITFVYDFFDVRTRGIRKKKENWGHDPIWCSTASQTTESRFERQRPDVTIYCLIFFESDLISSSSIVWRLIMDMVGIKGLQI